MAVAVANIENLKKRHSTSATVYCSDRKLIPRIKEYVKNSNLGSLDGEQLASGLLMLYPEYGRKKKQRFKLLVGKIYSSLCQRNQLELAPTKSPQSKISSDERKQTEHFKDRAKDFDYSSSLNGLEDDCVSRIDGEEMEVEDAQWDEEIARRNSNVMNDSITKLYGKSRSENSGETSGGTKLTWKPLPAQTAAAPPSEKVAEESTEPPTVSSEGSPLKTMKEKQPADPESSQEAVPRLQRKRRVRDKTKSLERAAGAHLQEKTSNFQVSSSSVRFSDMGGIDVVLEQLQKLLQHFHYPKVFTHMGVKPPRGILLHGPPGCGKTKLADAIAGELELPFIKLAATEVVSGVSGDSEATLRDLFVLAADHAPCILFIDEIDVICQKRDQVIRDMDRRITSQLLSCMDGLADSRVLVLGATSYSDSLDPALRREGRLNREICLDIPDQQARESILKVLGRSLRLQPGFSFSAISQLTPGYVAADLVELVREAAMSAVDRVILQAEKSSSSVEDESASKAPEQPVSPRGTAGGCGSPSGASLRSKFSSLGEMELGDVYITEDDFRGALKVVQPSMKREGFATIPAVTWEDVGALEDIREELCLAIKAPVCYPEAFAKLGLSSSLGILLAGPPGCGKTLLAKAIANEAGINFILVNGPEVFNKYVGESERAVRLKFQRARAASPCVIFFDEMDALCPRRLHMSENGASSRVVNQLLSEMDGVMGRENVFVIGATNRPDIIDPAILRPGRLKVLFVGLPSARDRAAILNAITKHGTKPELGPDVDIQELADDRYTGRFSGADLAALVREAALRAMKEYMPLMSGKRSLGSGDVVESLPNVVVKSSHFCQALLKVKPSVSKKEQQLYQEMASRYS